MDEGTRKELPCRGERGLVWFRSGAIPASHIKSPHSLNEGFRATVGPIRHVLEGPCLAFNTDITGSVVKTNFVDIHERYHLEKLYAIINAHKTMIHDHRRQKPNMRRQMKSQ